MRRWMWALCAVPMALAGCDDRTDDSCAWGGGYDDGSTYGQPGVSFDLSGVHDRLVRAAPADITACFDSDCDRVTLVVDNGQPRCDGAPGGPPDQLTSCSFNRQGDLRITIVRTDGRNYVDGSAHTAAIAVIDHEGERVLSSATQVRFATSSEIIEISPY